MVLHQGRINLKVKDEKTFLLDDLAFDFYFNISLPFKVMVS